jgi:predicted 2-oxoglutarate/Fe(II)-dependent dioxygenase YbiX
VTDLFAGLGLFVARGALDRGQCAALRAAMDAAPKSSANIGWQGAIDHSHRRSLYADVDDTAVRALLEELRPRVAKHFGRPLAGIEKPQFLIYEQGGFFREHVDVGGEGEAPRREIAVVLFLEQAHRGGALVLYDLMPGARTFGFPFAAEEGTLIAFPATLPHEVQVVEAGRRYTIASWFTGT